MYSHVVNIFNQLKFHDSFLVNNLKNLLDTAKISKIKIGQYGLVGT